MAALGSVTPARWKWRPIGSLILEPVSIGKYFPARLLEAVSFFFMALLR